MIVTLALLQYSYKYVPKRCDFPYIHLWVNWGTTDDMKTELTGL